MSTNVSGEHAGARHAAADAATFSIILALSFSHFLNDMMQSLVPALYPMLKDSYGLSFTQIGLITLTMQVVSSLLQPAVGLFADHRPQPYSLAIGMAATFVGLLLLASAGSYVVLLLAARWSAPVRRCSIRKPRGWRGWRRAGGTAWRNRCFRSAAMSDRRPGRSSRRSS